MSQVIFKETAERLSMSARQVIVCPSLTIVCMCKIVCECDDICVMCYGSRCRFTKCYNPYQPVHYLCRCLGNNSTNLVISPFCFCSRFYNCFMNAVSMEFFRTLSEGLLWWLCDPSPKTDTLWPALRNHVTIDILLWSIWAHLIFHKCNWYMSQKIEPGLTLGNHCLDCGFLQIVWGPASGTPVIHYNGLGNQSTSAQLWRIAGNLLVSVDLTGPTGHRPWRSSWQWLVKGVSA